MMIYSLEERIVMGKFRDEIMPDGVDFDILGHEVMDVIEIFNKEYNTIKMKSKNLYGLLQFQHERQELIKEWFK